MANIESDVLIEAPDQPMAACGFNLAYAAKRKNPARASRPMINRIRPSDPRASFVIEYSQLLLAQKRIKKLLQNRVSHDAGRRRVLLTLVENYKGGRGLYRDRLA